MILLTLIPLIVTEECVRCQSKILIFIVYNFDFWFLNFNVDFWFVCFFSFQTRESQILPLPYTVLKVRPVRHSLCINFFTNKEKNMPVFHLLSAHVYFFKHTFLHVVDVFVCFLFTFRVYFCTKYPTSATYIKSHVQACWYKWCRATLWKGGCLSHLQWQKANLNTRESTNARRNVCRIVGSSFDSTARIFPSFRTRTSSTNRTTTPRSTSWTARQCPSWNKSRKLSLLTAKVTSIRSFSKKTFNFITEEVPNVFPVFLSCHKSCANNFCKLK